MRNCESLIKRREKERVTRSAMTRVQVLLYILAPAAHLCELSNGVVAVENFEIRALEAASTPHTGHIRQFL